MAPCCDARLASDMDFCAEVQREAFLKRVRTVVRDEF